MVKKLFALAVVALLGFHSLADTLSDWQASIPVEDRRLPTDISVGEETIRWYDDGTFVYYYDGQATECSYHPSSFPFPVSKAKATRMGSYCRLDLNNYDGKGIEANGCLAIYQRGENYVNSQSDGISAEGGVFIGGSGSLTILSDGDGVHSDCSIAVEPGVLLKMTVACNGLYSTGGDLIMRGCMARIVAQRGDALYAYEDINISDSLICGYSREGRGINARVDISIQRSALDILSGSSCIYAGNVMNMKQSYFALADACDVIPEWRGYPGITGLKTYVDQCYGKVYSRCSALHGDELLSIGKGKYKIGSFAGGGMDRYGDSYYATCVSRDTVIIDGGDVKICAPNGTAVLAEDHFDMKLGSLEIVDSFDVSKDLFADAEMAFACTGVAFADGWHATMEQFYSQILADAIQNAKMSEISGRAFCGVAMCPGTEYEHRAGTLVCDKAQYGFVTDKFALLGGVFKGEAYTTDFKKIDLGTESGSGTGTGTGTGTGGGTDTGGGGSGAGGGQTDDPGTVPPTGKWNISVSQSPYLGGADMVPRTEFSVGDQLWCSLWGVEATLDGVRHCYDKPLKVRTTLSTGKSYDNIIKDGIAKGDYPLVFLLDESLDLAEGDYTLTCELDPDGEIEETTKADNKCSTYFKVVNSSSTSGGGVDTGGGGSGTGGGSDTGGGGSTSSKDQLNLKLVSFMPAIKRDDGNILNRKEFTVNDDVYFSANIFAYRDGMLTQAPEDVQYTVKVSNGFEETYLFDKSATGLGGYPIAVSMGRFPPGKYTMTCSINPNGLLEDLDPTDNVRTDSFEVIAEPGCNFAFDGAISVEGAAGRPVKATVAFHDEIRHPVVCLVECLFSVRANGRDVGSFVKSYGVGPVGWIKDTVDLAEHMSLPMGEYELTCRLDSNSAYAETNENDNEQTVSFRVAYPNVSARGFFDARIAHSYQGVLFRDGMTVLGTVAFQASAKSAANDTVRIAGTVTDVTGKKHAITGSTTVGKSVQNAIKCQVDVKGYGTFDLVLGDFFVIDNCYIGSKQKYVFVGDNGAGLSMCSIVDGIELELPHAQTPSSGGDVLPFASAAAVYDGSLQQGGRLVGTIQVKVAKGKVDKKTGVFSAKATATVLLADGSKKITFKNGVADASGKVTGLTAAGHALSVSLGASGMAGTMDGNSVDGARNVFSAKDAASKATAAAIEKKWIGAVNVVGDGIVLSVTVAKKGKVKVSGTVDGAKVSATSQLLVGAEACCIPVVITKKAKVAFSLWLMADGTIEVHGADSETSGEDADSPLAGKAGSLKAGAAFRMDGEALSRALPGLLGDFLPDGLSVAASGAKWVVAGGAKAGKVALAKGTSEVDPAKSKFTGNMPGLKLTYKQKDGSFKGSFKAYAAVNGKLKSYTINVAGVMVGAKGYGTATLKKPACAFPVTIE